MKKEIPFALDANGHLIDIFSATRGLACNCTCPGCGAPMLAKQGHRNAWHFAHITESNCQAGYESAIHLAVKKIISEERSLLLPQCNVIRSFDKPTFEYVSPDIARAVEANEYQNFERTGYARLPSCLVCFDEVHEEQAEGNIRPDLIGVVGGKRLYIEVAVTHFVDDEKRLRIRKRQTPAIEIQIPEPVNWNWSFERLRALCLQSTDSKVWVNNPRAETLALESYTAKEARYQARLRESTERLNKRAAANLERKKALQRDFERRSQEYDEAQKAFIHTHEASLCEPRFVTGEMSGCAGVVVMLCPSYVGVDIKSYGTREHRYRSGNGQFYQKVATVCERFGGKTVIFERWSMPTGLEVFIDVVNALCGECNLVVSAVQAPSQVASVDLLSKLEHVTV